MTGTYLQGVTISNLSNISNVNGLASGNLALLGTIDMTNGQAAVGALQPVCLDAVVQVRLAPTTVGGNTPVVALYASGSFDGGTTYTDGQSNSTWATSGGLASASYPEITNNCKILGAISLAATSGHLAVGEYDILLAFGGFPPPSVRIIAWNMNTNALASSGNSGISQLLLGP